VETIPTPSSPTTSPGVPTETTSPTPTEPITPVPTKEPEPTSPPATSPTNPPGSRENPLVGIVNPPIDESWFSPGKVQIGNYYPGGRASWPITIYNGKDKEALFTVSYREPDYTEEGFQKAPPEARDWIIVADSTPIIPPKEKKEVLITLMVPENITGLPDRWEFWISIMDTTQSGLVVTELGSRWLVTMR
jgi:hypothetical protein